MQKQSGTATFSSQHAAMMETLPYPMYLVSTEGQIVLTNQAFRDLLSATGIKTGAALEDKFASFQFRDLEGKVISSEDMPARQVLRTGNPVHTQLEVQIGGVMSRYALVSGGALRDENGDITGALMSVFDITEQKRTEHQLRDRGERLALAQAVSGCGMFDVDLTTMTVSATPEFEALCGLPENGMDGSIEDWTNCLEERERERFLDRLVEAWSRGEGLEFELRRRDTGEVRWMSARGRLIRGPGIEQSRLIGFLIDVTELRRARMELRATEGRYRMLVETIPVGVAIGYLQGPRHGLVTFANQSFLDITGHQQEDVDEGSVRWTNTVPPEWTEAELAALKALGAQGTSGVYEKEMYRTDGSRVPVEVAVSTFGGSQSEVVVVVREITQQKRMEDELRLREAEKTAIFNALPAGVSVVSNTPERWREANPAWLSIQGYTTLEEMRQSVLAGAHALHYVSGEPIPMDLWPSAITLRTGESVPGLEILIHRKDGKVIPALCSSAPVLGSRGEVRAAVVSIVEISELKRVEDSLRQRENERAAMLRALPTGMCVVDREHRVLEANEIWAEMWGFSSLQQMRDMQATHADLIRRYTPDGTLIHRDMWPSSICMRTRSTVRDVELIGERADTGRRWVALYSAAPVFDESGEISRVVVTAQNVTRLKEAEETLRLRTEQLASSNEELQAFAYTASHDLQEPLRTVALYTELLDRRCPTLEGPCVEYRRTIRANALRMQEMLQSLLTYSQLSQTDRPKSAVDVNRVLEAVVRSLASSIGSGDEIVFSGMPVVHAWEGRLEQVFQNLIGNSLKYRKPGQPVQVTISCSALGASWLFLVQDNGIGFRMDYAERIFGIFKRLHGRDEYSGTGIGLTIVRRIIERHAGRIWAESKQGEGSSFYFTLPRWG